MSNFQIMVLKLLYCILIQVAYRHNEHRDTPDYIVEFNRRFFVYRGDVRKEVEKIIGFK